MARTERLLGLIDREGFAWWFLPQTQKNSYQGCALSKLVALGQLRS